MSLHQKCINFCQNAEYTTRTGTGRRSGVLEDQQLLIELHSPITKKFRNVEYIHPTERLLLGC